MSGIGICHRIIKKVLHYLDRRYRGATLVGVPGGVIMGTQTDPREPLSLFETSYSGKQRSRCGASRKPSRSM